MTKISKKAIWVIVVITFLLAAFITLAALSHGFKNMDPTTWLSSTDTKKPTKTEEPEDKDKINVNGLITNIQNTETVSLHAVAYASGSGVANQAADGVRITATVLPEDASVKSVNYTIGWSDPTSTWATGKSVGDYVDMAVAGMSATVVCKEAFGEQIIVTCTSEFDESCFATCTVDYAKRITGIKFHCMYGSQDIKKDGSNITDQTTGKADTPLLFDTEYRLITVTPTYGVGTVSDTITKTVEFSASDVYVNMYCNGNNPGSYSISVNESMPITFNETFLQSVYGTSYVNQATFYSRCNNGAMIGSGVLKITFSVSGEYSSLSGTFNINFDMSTLGVAVSDVSLDIDSIVL